MLSILHDTYAVCSDNTMITVADSPLHFLVFETMGLQSHTAVNKIRFLNSSWRQSILLAEMTTVASRFIQL